MNKQFKYPQELSKNLGNLVPLALALLENGHIFPATAPDISPKRDIKEKEKKSTQKEGIDEKTTTTFKIRILHS